MWESAVPQPEQSGRHSDRQCKKTDSNVLLWVQLLLCAAVLIFVLAADAMEWSIYTDLRVFYETRVRRGGTLFLLQEREWAKFAETGLAELRSSAAEVFSELSAATPETARFRRGRSSPESYVPVFTMVFPLPDGLCEKTSGYGWRADPMGGQGTDRRSWRRQTAWYAGQPGTAAMAIISAFSIRMGMKHYMPICSICLYTAGKRSPQDRGSVR